MRKRNQIIITVSTFVTCGLLLGLLISPNLLSRVKRYTYDLTFQLGNAVGIMVGVPENNFNKLAQELTDYELVLEEKENRIIEREAILIQEETTAIGVTNNYLLILISIGMLLSGLLLLNFYLDWKRNKKQSEHLGSINLKRKF